MVAKKAQIRDGNKSVDVADINTKKCEDGVDRHMLDSADKIVRWIKYKFEDQKIEATANKWTLTIKIDLSFCIIYSKKGGKSVNENNFAFLDVIKYDSINRIADCFNRDGDDHNFANRIVNYWFECSNSIFYYASFQKTTFVENAIFDNTIFYNAAFFSNCNFKKYSSFKNAQFHSWCDFGGSHFNCVLFDKAEISVSHVNFAGCTFEDNVYFDNLKFGQITDPNGRQIISFRGSQFKNSVSFDGIIFTEESRFDGAIFEKLAEFKNCIFQYNASFDGVKVLGHLIFSPLDTTTKLTSGCVFDLVSFISAEISGRLELVYCNISQFNGRHLSVKTDGLFRVFASRISSINLNSFFNKGTVIFEKNASHIQEISLNGAINHGVFEVEETEIPLIMTRKTARILKDSATKSGNKIDALYYKAKEMKLYNKELKEKYKKAVNELKEKRSITSIFHFFITIPIWETLLLKLNTCSNKNGLSWIRGVCFTMFTAFAFYVLINYFGVEQQLFVFDWRFINYGEVWKGYLKVLNILNFSGEFEGMKLTAFGETLLFFSKIFISYGIYQTISAFRKYGK